MIKPEGYDNTEAFTGDFKKIALGGHIAKIMGAKVEDTSAGQVLVIMFDIVEGENKDYYQDDFKKKYLSNPDAKWGGTFRQFIEGKGLPFFKGMITAIENSNQGFKFNWDEATLKGKLFGAVFGQEEWLKDGEIKLSTKCVQIRSVEQVRKGVEVPALKKLKTSSSTGGAFDTSSFGSDFPEEEIPFG